MEACMNEKSVICNDISEKMFVLTKHTRKLFPFVAIVNCLKEIFLAT